MADSSKNENKSFFYKLVYNDKYLIFFSLFLAVLVWISTSISVCTDESKKIKIDVPVTISDELSQQLGMEYFSLQDSIELSVTVKGPKYAVGQVGEDDLNVEFDTSNVTKAGQQSIPILVTKSSKTLDFTVESVYPSSIEGYFDVGAAKTFDVDLKYDNSVLANGYAWGDPSLSDETVIVQGPKTYVDKITGVTANVDFENATNISKTYSAECSLNVEGDDSIEKSFLKITSKDKDKEIKSVSVSIPVVKKLVLPVNVKFEDAPKGIADNSILSVDYSVNKVTAGVLDGVDINEAVIGVINYNQLHEGKNHFKFTSKDFIGFKSIFDGNDNISADVTVDSKYKNQTVYIDKSAVKVTNVPNGYDYKLVFTDFKITVVAPENTKIDSGDLVYTCDASKLDDSNTADLVVTLSNHNDSWVYGTYKISVELTKK